METKYTVNYTEQQVDEMYIQLRDRMNTLSFGYAPTQSGCEFILLKRFFTPEDVYHWLKMPVDTMFTGDVLAEIEGISVDEALEVLEDMAHRGLLYRVRRGGQPQFRVMPVAHGVYEFNLDKVEVEWAMGLGQHMGEGLFPQIYSTNYPFYRSVPINAEVIEGSQILPYDNIKERMSRYDRWAVSPCVCRHLNEVLGADMSMFPSETCMTCGEMADFYVENKIARYISYDEACAIIDHSIDVGMVIQCCCSKDSEIICSCHGNGCGILQAAKLCPGEAMKNITHYVIKQDDDTCVGCGACAARCPMGSIQIVDGKAVTDASCIGCGQCVPACPTKARVLAQKPADSYDPLPQSIFDVYEEMQKFRKERGDF